MEKVKRENIGTHLAKYQFNMIGKDYEKVFLDDDKWRFNCTMTRKQYMEFHKYAVSLIMKTFRCKKPKAVSNFEWYWEMFGVRIKN